jgi:hypothetical protein
MNIIEALLKGMAFGFIMSTPIFVANYYLCKRLDKMVKMIEEMDCKISQ